MRYERKYRIDGLDKFGLESMILAHPAALGVAFSERRINNIYFDTPDWGFARENVNGVASRTKIRVRWYGEGVDLIQKPVLEIKSKSSLLGDKTLIALSDCQWTDLPAKVNEALLQRFPDQAFQPALTNTYRRSYYVSMDGRFRLTVDDDMTYGAFLPWHFSTPFLDTGLVVELKYESAEESTADEIARFLGLRLTKHSKYLRGLSVVYETAVF